MKEFILCEKCAKMGFVNPSACCPTAPVTVEMEQLIERTRAYLDYIEEHYNNVQKAWKEIADRCKDMRFVWDDYVFFFYH